MLKDSFFFVEGVKTENGLPVFAVRLNPLHVIFQVHFPDIPIVRRLYLSEVKNIKFLSVLDPVKTINFEVVFQKLTIDEDKLKATVLLQHADKQFAKISLIYVYMPI